MDKEQELLWEMINFELNETLDYLKDLTGVWENLSSENRKLILHIVSGSLPKQKDVNLNKDYYCDAGYSDEYKHAQRIGFKRGSDFVLNWIKNRQ